MWNRDQREEPNPGSAVTPPVFTPPVFTPPVVTPQAVKSPVITPLVIEERRLTAWIGKAVTIRGEVVASEDLIVDGQIEGRIDLRNQHLTVGVGATLKSDVSARVVTVRGSITGNITATERLEILETGCASWTLEPLIVVGHRLTPAPDRARPPGPGQKGR